MTRIEFPFETASDAAGASIASLPAMLHFHRTGERWKPRLVVVNDAAGLRSRPGSRPTLRVVPVREPQLRA
jgi:hypothetical protein